MLEAMPQLRAVAQAKRQFMNRAAAYLAAEGGIRQFLDIGTGLPTSPNLHEVVQAIDPKARVVYVDNDPIVLVNTRALLVGTPEGETAYIQADLRDPDTIVDAPGLVGTFDLTAPVAVSLIAILHFIVDDAVAADIVRRLMAPLPAGSALAITSLTTDGAPQMAGVSGAAAAGGIESKLRSKSEIESLFADFDLIDPGVVLINGWHSDRGPAQRARDVPVYDGVALKR